MDNTNIPLKYLKLGASQRVTLFKVLDTLCNPERQTLTRELWGKPNSKSYVNYDSLDYLKSISTKSAELQNFGKPINQSNSNVTNNNDVKKILMKNKARKKLYTLTDLLNESKLLPIKYLFTIPNSQVKTKNQVSLWFLKRKYSSLINTGFCLTDNSKQIRLEWEMEIEFISLIPTFYHSNKNLIIDTKKMVFYFKIKNLCGIEVDLQFVKTVTVVKNHSFVKFIVKPAILTELSYITHEGGENHSSHQIKANPKRVKNLKDAITFFTAKVISDEDVMVLKNIFGEDKVVILNDGDCKELYENVFNNMPNIVEMLSKNMTISWSSLNKDMRQSNRDVCNAIKNSFLTPKKSPMPVTNHSPSTASSIGNTSVRKLVNSSPVMQTHSNLVLHQSPTVVTLNNNIKPGVNTVYCSQNNTQFIGNHIVITPSLTANRLDPYPNLFNRMINDSPSLSELSVHSLPNQSNYSYTLTTNTGVQQINNFTSIFQRQAQNKNSENSDSSIGMANCVIKNINNNNVSANLILGERVLSITNLNYIPGRDTSNIFESFNYAPSPDFSVSIHGSDLTCLNEGQYLNDNIINFYLNYIRYEKITEDQRERSHLFNVFFYTKLYGSPTTGLNEPAEMKHSRVAKWTKKVDIFEKDFIIIPINEAQHWFLGIICFPWMAGMISYDNLYGLNNPQLQTEIPLNNSEFATKTRYERVKWLQTEKKIDPKPCILLFDSLQLQSRAPNVKLIREYLKSEWDAKRKARDGPLVFDKNTIRGFNPQVPQQSNTIDCGIYVLHYVEMFFTNPLPVFTKEYFQSSLTQWFDKETVEMNREFIQKLLLTKGEAQNHKESLLSPKIVMDDSGPDIQIVKIV